MYIPEVLKDNMRPTAQPPSNIQIPTPTQSNRNLPNLNIITESHVERRISAHQQTEQFLSNIINNRTNVRFDKAWRESRMQAAVEFYQVVQALNKDGLVNKFKLTNVTLPFQHQVDLNYRCIMTLKLLINAQIK